MRRREPTSAGMLEVKGGGVDGAVEGPIGLFQDSEGSRTHSLLKVGVGNEVFGGGFAVGAGEEECPEEVAGDGGEGTDELRVGRMAVGLPEIV
jgi:hypothetical protein